MYSFEPPFREATFCGVLSRIFDKSGCATGEEEIKGCLTLFQSLVLMDHFPISRTAIPPAFYSALTDKFKFNYHFPAGIA